MNCKQLNAIFTSFVYFFICFLQATDGNVDCQKIHVSSKEESIRLDCDDPSTSRNQWKHESDLLFANQNAISLKFADSTELYTNYSLIIHPSTKEHEGRYVCIRNSQVVVSYCLEFQSAPNLSIVIEEGNNTPVITVGAGSVLTIRCYAMSARPKVHLTLTVNNLKVASNEETHASVITNTFNESTFDTIATVSYQPEEGMHNVTCLTRGHFRETRIDKFFTVIKIEPPDVFVIIHGHKRTDGIYVEAGEEILLECNSYSMKPLLSLTWDLKGTINTTTTTSASSSKYSPENQTFHYQMFLKHFPQLEEENITCFAESEGPTEKKSASVHVLTYVPPIIGIFVNGDIIESTLSVPYGKELQLRCLASRARPLVNLKIQSSEMDYSYAETEVSVSQQLTYIDLDYRAYKPNTSITCLAESPIVGQEREKTIYFETIKEVTSTERKQFTNALFYAGLACLLVIANITCAGILQGIKAFKRSRSRTSLYASGLFLPERTSTNEVSYGNSHLPRAVEGNPEKCHPLNETVEKDNQNGADEISLDEEDYYSALDESKRSHRVFHLKDIRLIFNMKGGRVFNRWVGMLEVTNGPARCVVLSTINDETEHKIGIKWSTYVQRLLELPDTDSLVKTEGLCIGGANVYLISEYLTCETLEGYLTGKKSQDDLLSTNKFPEGNLIASMLDVFSGMEFIHSYGFLHPGLSTRKLLVTDNGKLKLYDFCLSEDASSILLIMKKQMNGNMNVLPPEALKRSEYTPASDVWSIAIIMSEIISKGFLPSEYQPDATHTTTAAKDALYNDWYSNSETFDDKDDAFSRCWNNDCSKRPTMRQLRFEFEQMFKMASTHVTTPDGAVPDLYIPMKGVPG